jgi:glycerol kinase
MSGRILAIDQGTDVSTRAILFDPDGRDARPRPGGVDADLPRGAAGSSTMPRRSGSATLSTLIRSRDGGGQAIAARTSPPSASPTSARPRWYGSATTGKPIHNAIVWQDRRTAPRWCRCATDGLGDHAHRARAPGLVVDAYFSGTKTRLAARRGARRCAIAAARGELCVRHHRLLPALAAHRRQGARHRRDQRLAHDAVRHPPAECWTR